MWLTEWITRLCGREKDVIHQRAAIDLIRDRRDWAHYRLFEAFHTPLQFIKEDHILNPSGAAEMVNALYEQVGRDDRADPRIASVAYGCIAGLISLQFDTFIRLKMTPELKGVARREPQKSVPEADFDDTWSGFEDRLIQRAERALYEWGEIFDLPLSEASLRARYFIAAYEESGCEELLSTWPDIRKFESFNNEQHKLSEHVVYWLATGAAPRLHGLLTGFWDKQSQAIRDEIQSACHQATPET